LQCWCQPLKCAAATHHSPRHGLCEYTWFNGEKLVCVWQSGKCALWSAKDSEIRHHALAQQAQPSSPAPMHADTGGQQSVCPPNSRRASSPARFDGGGKEDAGASSDGFAGISGSNVGAEWSLNSSRGTAGGRSCPIVTTCSHGILHNGFFPVPAVSPSEHRLHPSSDDNSAAALAAAAAAAAAAAVAAAAAAAAAAASLQGSTDNHVHTASPPSSATAASNPFAMAFAAMYGDD